MSSKYNAPRGSRGSTGNTRFSQVPTVQMPRSAFDRSRSLKTTFDASLLIPIYADEVLPGDTMTLALNSFVRVTSPFEKPIMDNMYLDVFFFFVPNRILQTNWVKLMGEQDNPGDSIVFQTPYTNVTNGEYTAYSLQDYLGLPTGSVGTYTHNTFHTRAYNLIWNEWFRDENLQDKVVVDLDDGEDDAADYVLLRRGKRKDYFTGCLPFAQKGEAVELSFGGTAPVSAADGIIDLTNGSVTRQLWGQNATTTVYAGDGNWDSTGGLDFANLEADLSAATGQTINAIRLAFQTQKFYERDARGGTRYTELVKSHFGVESDDARFQRPEYLGGGTTTINVHPVQQTAPTNFGNADAIGELSAFGTGMVNGIGFQRSFTEHGVILGLCCVRADLTYQSGLEKMYQRRTRFDYYFPSFAHLGEQAVLNSELDVRLDGNNDLEFGFQERYAEYRYAPSKITGAFRANNPTGSLDYWHLAQEFGTRPALNASFIEEDVPMDRVVRVPDEPHFLMDAWFRVNHVRPMPAYGVPGLVDHF